MSECSCVYWVGLDFGCTHSGFGLFRQSDECALHSSQHGPITQNVTLLSSPKFQTVLASGDTFMFKPSADQVTFLETQVENFKLLLMDDSLNSSRAQVHNEVRDEIQKLVDSIKEDILVTYDTESVEDMSSAYLTGLWAAAKDTLPVSNGRLRAVVAYPAVFDENQAIRARWSRVMSKATFEGAEEVIEVPEHQAALNAALLHGRGELWDAQTSRDSVVVVDCDGMTLDAILYELSDTPNPSAKQDGNIFSSQNEYNLVQDHGSITMCRVIGGVWLDRQVHNHACRWIQEKLSERTPTERRNALNKIMGTWQQRVKLSFSTKSHKTAMKIVVLSGFTYEFDMKRIDAAFFNVAEMIVEVSAQLLGAKSEHDCTKVVVLTGGLANSPYICKKVKTELAKYHRDAKVHIGKDPVNAVSIGAALWNVPIHELSRHSLKSSKT